mgnify:CR=1 FL=1
MGGIRRFPGSLNDFSGQIEKLGKLTNIKGMADFICSLGGKLFLFGKCNRRFVLLGDNVFTFHDGLQYKA